MRSLPTSAIGLADRLPALRRYAESVLTPPRLAHVLRTTGALLALCSQHGLDAARAEIAGLGHDLCRELGADELLAFARRDGAPIASWERREPVLLHGRAAAVLLATRFDVTDESILDAVRWHTTGRVGMDELAKALFIADYVEEGRTHVDGSFRGRVQRAPLDEGVLLIVLDTVRYLLSVGKEPAPPMLELQASLSEERAST